MPLVENRILRYSAAIHYTSEAERREAASINDGIAQHRSAVIPLPIESETGNAEDFIKHFPQVAGRRVILFLSRIDDKKGIELLLDAFTRVRRRFSDVVLVIAGAGAPNYVEELRRRAQGLNIADNVIWAGHVDGKVKAGAFDTAEVFVLPSHSENFGIAAAEALAAEVPTVITEDVGLSQEVREYQAGLIVEATPLSIDAAISDLLNDVKERQRLATAGKQLIANRFSPSSVGAAITDLYRQILTSKLNQ